MKYKQRIEKSIKIRETKPYTIKDGKVELTPTATATADATSSSTPGTPAEGYWKDKYKDVTTKT